MAKQAGDYVELFEPKGYVNNREITNIDSRFLVAPSKNTLVVNKEKVVSRKGYTLKGDAKTMNKGIKSSVDWKTNTGVKRSIRVYYDELEVWYNDAWRRVKNGFASPHMQFTTWWDSTELLDKLLFVNGDDIVRSWGGGITDIYSATTNTLTKKYYYSNTTIAFVNSSNTITDSASNFLNYGFAVGDQIVISGSTSNDGTYTIDAVVAGTITLSSDDSLTDETAGATVIVKVKGRGTWGEERFLASGTRKVVIDDIEYTYTGGEDTGTLTGVTPDPTSNSVGSSDIGFQAVTENADVPAADYEGDLIATINNHVFVGSTKSRDVYMSKSSDFTDFTYTALLRKPTEGFEMTIDNAPTAFIPDESTMYISAGEDDFYEVRFELNADQQGETIVIKQLKTATGQAAVGQGAITHIKNNVVFLSFEPTIDTLGRVQNIDTEQSVPISDDIRDLLESLDVTDAHGFYHRRNLYYSFPNDGIVLIYDTRFGYWQPPQELTVGRFALIDGVLCGHSSRTNETYILNNGLNDNSNKFKAVAAFGYENFGSRFNLKNFDELAAEVRLSRSTKLTDRILYEEDGSGGISEFEINTDDPLKTFSTDANISLGQNPLGSEPLGSLITAVSELVKVKVINTTVAQDFFERQRIFESDSDGVQFEILAFGENVQMSGNEPDFIKN